MRKIIRRIFIKELSKTIRIILDLLSACGKLMKVRGERQPTVVVNESCCRGVFLHGGKFSRAAGQATSNSYLAAPAPRF
jgi:hypothetical protein